MTPTPNNHPDDHSDDHSDGHFQQKTEILLRAAELLHRHGTPSHRLEGVMRRISESIGVKADYLYTPTSLFVAFEGDRQGARLMRIDAGPIELGKLADFDEALERLEHQQIPLEATAAELERIESAPHRYNGWQITLATAIAGACATIFLGGGWPEVVVAMILGLMVRGLTLFLEWIAPEERLLEFTSGFGCALLALMISRLVYPFDDRLATLGALIVLLPGLGVTISMMELANRHLSSGVSRMAGASVVLLTLAVGVALAWRLGGDLRPAGVTATPMSISIKYLAMLIAPISFVVLFRARIQDWLRISLVSWIGFIAADLTQSIYGVEWGGFIGAAAIGLFSNVYARFFNRPSLILQMPAILLLVPGSLGYKSVTAFIDQQGVKGLEAAFSMSLVAMALAGGLITANAVLAPRRYL